MCSEVLGIMRGGRHHMLLYHPLGVEPPQQLSCLFLLGRLILVLRKQLM